MSLLLALVLAASPDADLAARVEDLVARLAGAEYEARERTSRELAGLGADAEPLLRDALARSQDPEVRERLDEALRGLVERREEAFALACLRAGDPFPEPAKRPGSLQISQATIAQAVEKVAGEFGLEIVFFEDDRWLREEAAAAPVLGSAASSASDPLRLLEYVLTNNLELAHVVAGKRITIVRLTPAILLARLAREEGRGGGFQEQSTVEGFFSPRHDHWSSIHHFIQLQAQPGREESRAKWVKALAAAAKDPGADAASRCTAVRGFRWLYGAADAPQHDSTGHLLGILRDAGAPEAVRAEARRVLPHCPEPEVVEEILRVLEGRDAEPRKDMLLALGGTYWRGISALPTLREDPEQERRLLAALVTLASSTEAEVAAAAISLRVLLGVAEAVEPMNALPLSSERDTSWMIVEALRRAAFKDFAGVKERIDALAEDKDPKLRAAAACLYGRSAGGRERGHDVQQSLKLLGDPAPVARACAAHALGVIYSLSASEPYKEGLDSCLERLERLLKEDPDERVKAYATSALQGIRGRENGTGGRP